MLYSKLRWKQYIVEFFAVQEWVTPTLCLFSWNTLLKQDYKGGDLLSKEKISNLVYKLVEPVVMKNGMELVDVEFVKEGSNQYLRLFLDKDGGVNLDDCEQISKIASELLDKEDPIKQAYFLEVSSPGVDRPLKKEKDFQKYQGYQVMVKTYSPFEGKKKLRGKLGRYDQLSLNLYVENNREIAIPWEIISQVKLDWEE
jgi:ribosome maturation factor RimP